jgi:uncharacterized protein
MESGVPRAEFVCRLRFANVETGLAAVSCAEFLQITRRSDGAIVTPDVRHGALTKDDGTVVCARCAVADRPLLRMRGLLGRSSLAAGEGMLFRPAGSIHMFFMRFPIDAVFLAKAGSDGSRRVVSTHRAVRPWVGLVPMVRGAEGVLELPVGAIDASGTVAGDSVRLA